MTLFPLGLEQNLHPIPLGPAATATRLLPTICIPAVAIEDQADTLAVLDKMDILAIHESMDILVVHESMDILDIHDALDILELSEDLPTASIIPGCEA